MMRKLWSFQFRNKGHELFATCDLKSLGALGQTAPISPDNFVISPDWYVPEAFCRWQKGRQTDRNSPCVWLLTPSQEVENCRVANFVLLSVERCQMAFCNLSTQQQNRWKPVLKRVQCKRANQWNSMHMGFVMFNMMWFYHLLFVTCLIFPDFLRTTLCWIILKSIHELARYALALEPAPMGAGHRKVGSAGHLCRGQGAVSSDLHFFNKINHNHFFHLFKHVFQQSPISLDILGNLVPCTLSSKDEYRHNSCLTFHIPLKPLLFVQDLKDTDFPQKLLGDLAGNAFTTWDSQVICSPKEKL